MKIDLSVFPVLYTNRLILRALSINDREELFRLRSDKRVNRYIGRSGNISLADVDTFIQKIHLIIANNDGVYWAISLKDESVLIGTICYWNLQPEKDMADIGYELLPDYQGKGLMKEAVEAVINYAFDVMDLKVITALTHPNNLSSNNLLERIGFNSDTEYQYVSKDDAGEESVYVLIKGV